MTDQARILIIEDERDIREMMRFDLCDAGYYVETAADGVEGLHKFGSGENWDLVLLDQRMPRMEGVDVLRHMGERDSTARVIMVTAHATLELATKARQCGAVDLLRKPFSFDMLRGAVKAALAQPRRSIVHDEAIVDNGESPAYVTLNGYRLRPVPLPPGEEETARLRVRRAYEVESPSGETRYCAVDISLYVRQIVAAALGQDRPPVDPLWDKICESVLSSYLWQKAEIAPEILPVFDLTEQQLEVARSF